LHWRAFGLVRLFHQQKVNGSNPFYACIYFLMATFTQIINFPRIPKLKKYRSPKLKKNPQKKAVCFRLLTISPKKPNSANRRVAKVNLINNKTKLTAKIPGEFHNLQQHLQF